MQNKAPSFYYYMNVSLPTELPIHRFLFAIVACSEHNNGLGEWNRGSESIRDGLIIFLSPQLQSVHHPLTLCFLEPKY